MSRYLATNKLSVAYQLHKTPTFPVRTNHIYGTTTMAHTYIHVTKTYKLWSDHQLMHNYKSIAITGILSYEYIFSK